MSRLSHSSREGSSDLRLGHPGIIVGIDRLLFRNRTWLTNLQTQKNPTSVGFFCVLGREAKTFILDKSLTNLHPPLGGLNFDYKVDFLIYEPGSLFTSSLFQEILGEIKRSKKFS